MLAKVDFLQARNFIYSDIQRELDLARDRKNAGNFMLALALLCYTEFGGGLKRNIFAIGESRNNFDSFFGDLGPKYSEFLKSVNVYDVFRCGLAHEYFVKRDCVIGIFTNREMGIGFDDTEHQYYFAVDQYFQDFRRAFDVLEKKLYS